MAIHTGFRRRNPGKGGSLHARMAVAAIDSVVAHVMFVAKLHGLFARDVLASHVRRARRIEHRQGRPSDQKNKREDTKTGDEVGASMKNLGHFRFLHFGGERAEWALTLG